MPSEQPAAAMVTAAAMVAAAAVAAAAAAMAPAGAMAPAEGMVRVRAAALRCTPAIAGAAALLLLAP